MLRSAMLVKLRLNNGCTRRQSSLGDAWRMSEGGRVAVNVEIRVGGSGSIARVRGADASGR